MQSLVCITALETTNTTLYLLRSNARALMIFAMFRSRPQPPYSFQYRLGTFPRSEWRIWFDQIVNDLLWEVLYQTWDVVEEVDRSDDVVMIGMLSTSSDPLKNWTEQRQNNWDHTHTWLMINLRVPTAIDFNGLFSLPCWPTTIRSTSTTCSLIKFRPTARI